MNGKSDQEKKPGRAITVGTFDGVHRGHLSVISELLAHARRNGLRPTVITLEPHPLMVVAPERAPGLLESAAERRRRLENAGVEVITVAFDDSVRKLSAFDWMRKMKEQFSAELLVTGYDNTFGCDGRELAPDDYAELGNRIGLKVVKAGKVQGVSSSVVRKAVSAGEMERAAELLGRPYAIEGEVVHGRELGRKLGFPTANVAVEPGLLLPAAGVYGCKAILADGSSYKAVVNVGRAPTVAEGLPVTVEAYLPGFSGDLYGSRMRLEFGRKLRGEKKFGNLEELRHAIAEDVKNLDEKAGINAE